MWLNDNYGLNENLEKLCLCCQEATYVTQESGSAIFLGGSFL
jgi:hypothetical protein